MTKPKHTPEPWEVSHSEFVPDRFQILAPPDGRTGRLIICDGLAGNSASPLAPQAEANAARIVACVNALAGIEDPAAIGELVEAAEALYRSVGSSGWQDASPKVSERKQRVVLLNALRAALAKVKREGG